MTPIICGIDVSSTTLDARIGPAGACIRVANTPAGVEQLAAWCRAHNACLAVMEATGGYERVPYALLWAAGIPAAIANPRAVRRFAEAMGVLEKTDRINAGLIAGFAQARGLQAMPPPPNAQARLAALVTRLRQLTDTRVVQANQRRLVTDPDVLASFAAVTSVITQQIRSIEAQVGALISADPLWAKLDKAFRSIKAVADRTVARLMAALPEIGTLDNKAIAKLAGLAPIARDSGKTSGRRSIQGGRESVRSILFVVAELVRRHNPDFAAFHRKLTQAGKPPKVVRVAPARKLLVQLNAKARDARNELAAAA